MWKYGATHLWIYRQAQRCRGINMDADEKTARYQRLATRSAHRDAVVYLPHFVLNKAATAPRWSTVSIFPRREKIEDWARDGFSRSRTGTCPAGTLGEHGIFPVLCSLFPVHLRIPPPQKKNLRRQNLASGGPAGHLVTCSLFPVPCSHNTSLREHVFRVPCSLSPYGKTHPWKTLLLQYEIGTTNAPSCCVPVLGDYTICPKIMENRDNYSTAPWRNMRRSPRGNLVQWVNLYNERRASSSYNYDSCCVISPAVARCL